MVPEVLSSACFDDGSRGFEIRCGDQIHIGHLQRDTLKCYTCASLTRPCPLTREAVEAGLQAWDAQQGEQDEQATRPKLKRVPLKDVMDWLSARYQLSFDGFAQRLLYQQRPIQDTDVIGFLRALQEEGHTCGLQTMQHAVEWVARQRQFDPLQQYFRTLEWDETPRLALFLAECFGCPDDLYHSEVGKRFLIGAVQRAMEPGCHHRTVLLLIGEQGQGKSLFCRDLCPREEWFTDYLPADLSSREASEAVLGKFIIEHAELAAHRKSTIEAIKAFISRPIENFRPAYGRWKIQYQRRCVIIGTTNDDEPLANTDENLRFWPVRIRTYNREWLLDHKDQLWAEALWHYDNGIEWWRLDEELQLLFAVHRESAISEELFAEALSKLSLGPQLTLRDATHLLNIPDERVTRSIQIRVSAALAQLGYRRKQVRYGGRRWWTYEKFPEVGDT